jgi:hypothetical protein
MLIDKYLKMAKSLTETKEIFPWRGLCVLAALR